MTDKQIKTLVLYAQNYSLPVIAIKQKVSLSTIRERISNLQKNHAKEFENADSLRNAYKRTRNGIRNVKRFGEALDVAGFVWYPEDTKGIDFNVGRIHKLF